jgi:hypothetical protein
MTTAPGIFVLSRISVCGEDSGGVGGVVRFRFAGVEGGGLDVKDCWEEGRGGKEGIEAILKAGHGEVGEGYGGANRAQRPVLRIVGDVNGLQGSSRATTRVGRE